MQIEIYRRSRDEDELRRSNFMDVQSHRLNLAEEKLVSLVATLSPVGLTATEDAAESPKPPLLPS